MFFTIIVIIGTLVALMALHELGHFLVAKKFGVKVEEFGIGYPPRLWGKKIGETLYSINLIPFGAFVKILGSDERVKGKNSFSEKSLGQRALILAGGVISFWLLGIIILTFVGAFTNTDVFLLDNVNIGLQESRVQIIEVADDSPAQLAGVQEGDIVKGFSLAGELHDFIQSNLGKEMELVLQREEQEITVALTPRIDPPQGQGATGIAPVKVVNLKTTWYKALPQAGQITLEYTKLMPLELFRAAKQKLTGQQVTGVKLVGPIGIFEIMGYALKQGLGSFLMFVAMIVIWLALFNALPIPALDGGRLLFLVIEAIRRKPLPEKIEQKLNLVFFFILIGLMVLVSVRDIWRFF